MNSNKLLEYLKNSISSEEHQIKYLIYIINKLPESNKIEKTIKEIISDKETHYKLLIELLNLAKAHFFHVDIINEEFLELVNIKKHFNLLEVNEDDFNLNSYIKNLAQFLLSSIIYYVSIKEIVGKDLDLDLIIKNCKNHYTTLTYYANTII